MVLEKASASESDRIGPYRIVDTLGEGGMGTVYLAEQTEPVRRRVALKIIKLGMDSKAVVARFEQERQALALMSHDGIAKVFDCGTTERGQPYFVMELVKGVPLTEFCDQHTLDLPDRLHLMQQVCAAVTHAHQKGVVHRDLKPSNVLVADEGGKLQIKIIDFGLAKAMGQKLVEATLFTEAGQVVGTPEYMAPEQADPTNADIDTRADIYSLGVMLYEVLVGSLPFPQQELRKAGMLEVQRILRQVDPPKPSRRLTAIGDSASVATSRRTSVRALQRALRTDLDWIVLKALEKDRNRRYETAHVLAADMQRFLDHEPLVAGPPSASYQLKKTFLKYRSHFLVAAVVVGLLVLGLVSTLMQVSRVQAESLGKTREMTRTRMVLWNTAAMFASDGMRLRLPSVQDILDHRVEGVSLVTAEDSRDSWGQEMRLVQLNAWGAWRVESAGPDGSWETMDDMVFEARAFTSMAEERVRRAVKINAQALSLAAKLFAVSKNRLPGDIAELYEARLLEGSPTMDPWGNPFSIQVRGETASIVSSGPDGRPDSGDEIAVPIDK